MRPPAASVSRTTCPASAAEPSGASMLSAATRNGSISRSHSGPLQASASAILAASPRQQQLGQLQIFAKPRARHAARPSQHPVRNRPVVGAQRPAPAAREIHERKRRRPRPDQLVRARRCARHRPASRGCPTAPDGCRCRSPCRAWRRNRSGSARRLRARLVDATGRPRRRKLHRRRKPREARADHMHLRPRSCQEAARDDQQELAACRASAARAAPPSRAHRAGRGCNDRPRP